MPYTQGVIVVIETPRGIVFVHPPGGGADARASLVGGPVETGEPPEEAAVRYAAELTGLQIRISSELVTFVQEATPFGTIEVVSFVASATGGALRADRPEGPAVAYPLDELPAIVPVRAANQRVLAAYVESRGRVSDDSPVRT